MLEFKGAVTNKFAQFAAERVEIRKREGSMRKDLFHYLVRQLPHLFTVLPDLVLYLRSTKTGTNPTRPR